MVSREMRDMTPTDFTSRFGEFPTREGLTILVVSLCLLCIYVVLSICILMCMRRNVVDIFANFDVCIIYWVHMMCDVLESST